MDNKKIPKNTCIFICKLCDYTTRYKRDFDKHLMTAKHKRITDDNILPQEIQKIFVCICGKEYKNRHNLCRHRRDCDFEESIASKPVVNNTELSEIRTGIVNSSMIIDIIKENQEIKNLLMEQSKQFMEQNNLLINKLTEKDSIITNINNSNSNNTTNNLQRCNEHSRILREHSYNV
jgi:hypothetical protein